MMMESMFERCSFDFKGTFINDCSIEDDFMAWTTIFWESVCQKYQLVINTEGGS